MPQQWRHSRLGNWYVHNIEAGETRPIAPPTNPPTTAYATWSPTGESIAYVSNNDLYVLQEYVLKHDLVKSYAYQDRGVVRPLSQSASRPGATVQSSTEFRIGSTKKRFLATIMLFGGAPILPGSPFYGLTKPMSTSTATLYTIQRTMLALSVCYIQWRILTHP